MQRGNILKDVDNKYKDNVVIAVSPNVNSVSTISTAVHHTLWFPLYLPILLFHILSLIICYIFLLLVDKTTDIH